MPKDKVQERIDLAKSVARQKRERLTRGYKVMAALTPPIMAKIVGSDGQVAVDVVATLLKDNMMHHLAIFPDGSGKVMPAYLITFPNSDPAFLCYDELAWLKKMEA